VARAVERAGDRLVQHVGPTEVSGQAARPQPGERAEAHEIGI
jgi:hypothetical protein